MEDLPKITPIYDEAQQEAALSDIAMDSLPRKCLVLRLGDAKQTSDDAASDLARKIRLVSDQLALGIRPKRRLYLLQALPDLLHCS